MQKVFNIAALFGIPMVHLLNLMLLLPLIIQQRLNTQQEKPLRRVALPVGLQSGVNNFYVHVA
ncbi:hypothetical protein AWJ24_09230 [Escherichia coli]|nr:hypothetical protein AWJ24_09230 [Escherichia coli]OKV62559.1 hypothetical protein AWP57_25330 [Escherichia coli]OKV76664.1 hypothetical protein AWP64_27555 [Escherichia coli]OKV98460.1 hypothetical protein AWP65_14700 [Escherichia coli]OKW04289.1 hypothetical protein AWP68_14005 [Escherichia coli]